MEEIEDWSRSRLDQNVDIFFIVGVTFALTATNYIVFTQISPLPHFFFFFEKISLFFYIIDFESILKD